MCIRDSINAEYMGVSTQSTWGYQFIYYLIYSKMGCAPSNLQAEYSNFSFGRSQFVLFDVANEQNINKLDQAAPPTSTKPDLLQTTFQGTEKISQMLTALKNSDLKTIIDISEKDLMNPNENLSSQDTYWSVLHYAAQYNNKAVNGIYGYYIKQ
eukprot:TRINITY_DN10738_c0_g1_i11.p2 TRINITY_DN10738_c0_g1~~TRINITY_DN10738_c0_g1_i11.p2  ORF type:complete len:154 (+),score=25.78 TRINITY_DN10738_c0_g1_i11:185-646(+)